ncbi:hypothetical protein [Streptomyces sp. IBSBF 2435]|uniref:hypothetical protein n=1 Tax=Streptomyces sp. IBSBF 2435 TaxID=2903531 RepID=UPI002FDC50F3
MLASIPAWQGVLLRRIKLVSDEQLADTFESGYRLHAQHVAQASSWQPPEDDDQDDQTGRHDR